MRCCEKPDCVAGMRTRKMRNEEKAGENKGKKMVRCGEKAELRCGEDEDKIDECMRK